MVKTFKDYKKKLEKEGFYTPERIAHMEEKKRKIELEQKNYQTLVKIAVKDQMETLGITFDDLSKRTGKSTRTLQQLTRGDTFPRMDTLLSVFSELGIELSIKKRKQATL